MNTRWWREWWSHHINKKEWAGNISYHRAKCLLCEGDIAAWGRTWVRMRHFILTIVWLFVRQVSTPTPRETKRSYAMSVLLNSDYSLSCEHREKDCTVCQGVSACTVTVEAICFCTKTIYFLRSRGYRKLCMNGEWDSIIFLYSLCAGMHGCSCACISAVHVCNVLLTCSDEQRCRPPSTSNWRPVRWVCSDVCVPALARVEGRIVQK